MGTRRKGALVLGVLATVVGAVGCRPGSPETGFGDGGTVVLEGPAGAASALSAAPASW